MGSLGVIPIEPVGDDAEGLVAVFEPLKPDAFLLQVENRSIIPFSSCEYGVMYSRGSMKPTAARSAQSLAISSPCS